MQIFVSELVTASGEKRISFSSDELVNTIVSCTTDSEIPESDRAAMLLLLTKLQRMLPV